MLLFRRAGVVLRLWVILCERQDAEFRCWLRCVHINFTAARHRRRGWCMQTTLLQLPTAHFLLCIDSSSTINQHRKKHDDRKESGGCFCDTLLCQASGLALISANRFNEDQGDSKHIW